MEKLACFFSAKIRLVFFLALVVTLAYASCAECAYAQGSLRVASYDSYDITATSEISVRDGSHFYLKAPDSGRFICSDTNVISFSSYMDDSSEISSSTTVYAKKPGTAIINFTKGYGSDKKEYNTVVTVTPVYAKLPIHRLTLNTLHTNTNKVIDLSDGVVASCSSSNKKVATVKSTINYEREVDRYNGSIYIEAKKAGTSIIKVTDKYGHTDSLNVTVVDDDAARFRKAWPSQITLEEGETWYSLDSFLTGCRSSNTKVATAKHDICTIDIKAKKRGKTTVTVESKFGTTAKIKVNVIGCRLKARVSQNYLGGRVSSKENDLTVLIKGTRKMADGDTWGRAKWQLYRSTSKNGKYILVGSGWEDEYLYPGYECDAIDKNLKPNKKYWYKVRASRDGKNWGVMSTPKAFWTAVKNPAKVKLSGDKITWSKVKGAKGYAAGIKWSWLRGYNIFGKPLFGHATKWKNAGKKRKISANYGRDYADWRTSFTAVAYTKHDGYYYIDGCSKSKNLKSIYKQILV